MTRRIHCCLPVALPSVLAASPVAVWRVLLLLTAALLLSTPARAQSLQDNFDDNQFDTSRWRVEAWGTGPTIAEVNQRLEITVPANSAGSTFSSGPFSRVLVHGDFDVQVDYQLLNWPQTNGVRAGFVLFHDGPAGPSENLARVSLGPNNDEVGQPRECYSMNATGRGLSVVATADLAGKLRLVRLGSVLNGYHAAQGTEKWTFLGSEPVETDDVELGLWAWSHDYAFADQLVRVAFDNFVLNGGAEVVGAINGRVTQGGAGVDGVAVTAGDRSALTGSDGSYRIADLDPGTYVVRPSRTGYQFTPMERTVLVDVEEEGVDFTAAVSGPGALAGLSVDPLSLQGGTPATGMVTLTGPAPRAASRPSSPAITRVRPVSPGE
jgi:hypothetical protein